MTDYARFGWNGNVPRESVQNASGRRRFEEAHRAAEYRIRHSFVQLARSLEDTPRSAAFWRLCPATRSALGSQCRSLMQVGERARELQLRRTQGSIIRPPSVTRTQKCAPDEQENCSHEGKGKLTSMEQKIQSISVCTTTSAAEPKPKAK